MSTLIRYQGRLVSLPWYNRYIRGIIPKPPSPPRQMWVRFHMPANLWALEPAETRLTNLANRRARRWVEDISAAYAEAHRQSNRITLTTFFPDLA